MTDTDINIEKYKSLTVKDGSVYKVKSIEDYTLTLVDKDEKLMSIGIRYLLHDILKGNIVLAK